MRIAVVVVKLKVFKALRTDSPSLKWHFLGGFEPLLPHILTRGSTLANKNTVRKKFEGFEFS